MFGEIETERLLAQDTYFVVIFDKYPVAEGHSLIVAKRSVALFKDLNPEEADRLVHWIHWTQDFLKTHLETKPDAFNCGLNDGVAAGQTVSQFHFHIIPRKLGDVPDPRGGIRAVIPSRAAYWSESK